MVKHVHGTAIARGEAGVLLLGPPNAGKSDLALRCLCIPLSYPKGEPFTLVSDDQTVLEAINGALVMTPPATIAGLLEVRGLGIFTLPFQKRARLSLIVRLTNQPIARLPEDSDFTEYLHEQEIRRIWLNPFEASAPVKIALALRAVLDSGV